MKIIFKILIIVTFLGIVTCSYVQGYSDDLFEFDLPDNYGTLNYQNLRVFSDTENSDKGMMIYADEDVGLKKSVWNLDSSDVDTLVSRLGMGTNIIETDRKAKLGKEKALKVTLNDDEDYMECYIMASNKYIYMVAFMSDSQEGLENEDFKAIKKSFKLKDSTTNPIVVYVLIIMVIIGIKVFFTIRKNKKMQMQGNELWNQGTSLK